MNGMINVAVLDDHQSIIDGYLYRLSGAADIRVVASALYGEDLVAMVARQPVDVLLLDVQVTTSRENQNIYPILYLIPALLERYPRLNILVISMHAQKTLIRSVMEAGASGYVLKEDQAAINDLPAIIRMAAAGGMYLSQTARDLLRKKPTGELSGPLSERQLQALALCAAYPDDSSSELAKKMSVANSTLRNLLSGVYFKLEVHTRAAAIAKARRMGLLPGETNFIPPEAPASSDGLAGLRQRV